jgi:hypothetical protein
MEANTARPLDDDEQELYDNDYDERITRADTGLRILLTLLMAVIWGLVETALAVAVIFSIVWTLIVQQQPPSRLRQFTNRLVSYSYRLWRYMTYNEARVPFPFSDFPDEIEPPAALATDSAVELRELLDLKHKGEPPA